MAQHKELADFVCGELSLAADPARAVAMAAYMKTEQPFYGVAAPRVHIISREARKRFVPASRTAYERNVLALWRRTRREARYVAVAYAKQRAFLLPESTSLYERMIREGAWWDFVDDISANLVGQVVLHHRETLRPVLERWIADPDLWIRRAALLAQLRHKRSTDTEQLFGYCLKCAGEKDFFIRKAIGWALREYSKTDANAVKAFLRKNCTVLSPLSLREGAKHLDQTSRLHTSKPTARISASALLRVTTPSRRR